MPKARAKKVAERPLAALAITNACLPPEMPLTLVGGESATVAEVLGGKFAMLKFFHTS